MIGAKSKKFMLFIDVHNVGYGECIVFEGEKNQILMIDCGSMNNFLKDSQCKFKNYVSDIIMPRYSEAKEKSFLLTHFHKDHFCGFKHVLKKQKNYFDKIYIPYPAVGENERALLLEVAIYAFVFLKRQQSCANMSTNSLFIFNFLKKNSYAKRVIPLKRDDIFKFSGINYKVLSPFCNSFPFSKSFVNVIETLDSFIKDFLKKEQADEFFRLKSLFCKEYINCSNLCRKEDFLSDTVYNSVNDLQSYLMGLNNLSKIIYFESAANKVISFLNKESTKLEYSLAQNSASIVFQNEFFDKFGGSNILMTGDVNSEILNLLENDLFQNYNVIKVPHHGTANYYSNVLNKLNCSHMIISNGEYYAGGKIFCNYANNKAIKHCTNNNCDYFKKFDSCCNRLLFCESLNKRGDLSSRCSKKHISCGLNSCKIYINSESENKGCYCD